MKRVLVSVYDKEGVVDLSKGLESLGWEIVSTGGTYKLLKEAGIRVKQVEEITFFPEILDGRVKTLNPKIHGGLLYKRDNKDHIKTISDHGIGPIDMVVNNLYPFEETIRSTKDQEAIIENIDIGGPSMIRAGAKNYKSVTVIVDPKDYGPVLEEIRKNGDTSLETRQYLARKVFNYTSYYDSLISNYFNELEGVDFPDYLSLGYKLKDQLRYGENPHQKGAFYEDINLDGSNLGSARKLHGKELSFNNINDGNGAIEALKEFDRPTAVAVKHANPCGIGSGDTLYEAYIKAYESDPVSIFGGILAVNRPVEEDLAKKLNEIFLELIIAPSFTKEALEILKTKENLRLIEIDNIQLKPSKEKDIKKVLGGILVQDRDSQVLLEDYDLVSGQDPSEEDLEELLFAFKAAKSVKSNGVVITKDQGTIGIGLGEVNRVWAVKNAIERAGDKVKGAFLGSDGFFPFKDSIELLAEAGIKGIIQPGGSIRDKEVIDEAKKHGITMIFTGIRHFKH